MLLSNTLSGMIRAHRENLADRVAITAVDRTLSFSDLDARSSQVAQALRAAGVERGDRIAYLDKNAPEFFEILFGGSKVGAVTVPISWRLGPDEVTAILIDAGAKVLVIGQEMLRLIENQRRPVPNLQTTLVVGGEPGRHSYADWIGERSPVDPAEESQPSAVVMQLYTSGTTGEPKGVMLTEGNLAALMAGSASMLHLDADSVNLVAMPLFHIGGSGYALIGMFAGCRTVLAREADPVALLAAISDEGVTNAFVVPAVLASLLAMPGLHPDHLAGLRAIAYGASPISETLLRRAIKMFGCEFVQVYGLTETTGTITALSAEDHRLAISGGDFTRLRSAGRPIEKAEIRVASADGQDAAPLEVGEIMIRSPQNTVGYWNKPEETSHALTADGWLRTGDAGYIDTAGYLFIHDRVKDMIISGGENVYPAEVENVIMAHPAVADVAVVGAPSERWGETVVAVVVRADGQECTEPDVIEFCRSRIGHFKCPTRVDFVASLPRNASGKVLKRDVRAPFWAGHSRPVG